MHVFWRKSQINPSQTKLGGGCFLSSEIWVPAFPGMLISVGGGAALSEWSRGLCMGQDHRLQRNWATPGPTPARAQEPDHFSVATHCVGSIWHFGSSLLGTDGSAPVPSDNTSTTFCFSCSFTDWRRKWRQQMGPGIYLPTPWEWWG